jgi:hypothetical protein
MGPRGGMLKPKSMFDPLLCSGETLHHRRRTLDYVEICPHNLPNSSACDVDLIFHGGSFYGNFSG